MGHGALQSVHNLACKAGLFLASPIANGSFSTKNEYAQCKFSPMLRWITGINIMGR